MSNPEVFGGARWIAEYAMRRGGKHAPVFRRRFFMKPWRRARCAICGLGHFHLRFNGRAVSDDLLTPAFTRYDLRCEYYLYDVTDFLIPGENVVEIVLGNSFYNQTAPDRLRSERQIWSSDPRLLFHLTADDRSILVSDQTWRVAHGPIVENTVRTGEKYDARLELPPWQPEIEPDPAVWRPACLTHAPGGLLEQATAPACRVMRTLKVRRMHPTADGAMLYDFGENIAGNCRIVVTGSAGATLRLVHGEKLNAAGDLDNGHIGLYTLTPDFQTDVYTLDDRPEQEWAPLFSCHGFQYVKVFSEGGAELKSITARVIRSSFDRIGSAHCADAALRVLTVLALRSYEANFVNTPTDCPHREKMGWTGDAQLTAELGLWYYRVGENYRAWLKSIRDCQRMTGQIPGTVPYCNHWQFGPVWDSALIVLPYQVWRFTGDEAIVRENYAAGRKLMQYFADIAQDDIIAFGPGDWAHPGRSDGNPGGITAADLQTIIPGSVDATAYYYRCAEYMTEMARVAGTPEECREFAALAARIKAAFQREFCRPGGHCAGDEATALGLALDHGLVDGAEKTAMAARLDERMRRVAYRADFGISGAKAVPRALAANGYFDTALQVLTQRRFPGWGHWLVRGATSLWESWGGDKSRNHVMFGDLGAWLWEYAGGVRPEISGPGFAVFQVEPPGTERLAFFEGRHEVAGRGELRWAWRREGETHVGELWVPPGCVARFRVPGEPEAQSLTEGRHVLQWDRAEGR